MRVCKTLPPCSVCGCEVSLIDQGLVDDDGKPYPEFGVYISCARLILSPDGDHACGEGVHGATLKEAKVLWKTKAKNR